MMRTNFVLGCLSVLAATVGIAACGSPPTSDGVASQSAAWDNDGGVRRHHVKIAAVLDRTDLVTDSAEADLVNAWGLAFNPTGIAWISANGTGRALVLDSSSTLRKDIALPRATGATEAPAPTGMLFNPRVAPDDFMADVFVMVTEDGTVIGWQPDGTEQGSAKVRVDASASGAIFKGAALVQSTGCNRPTLLVADFHNGILQAFDSDYGHQRLAKGAFTDASLPSGFAPFNVVSTLGIVLVSYALQDDAAKDDVAGVGNGFVDAFDVDGSLLERIASGGTLNSPWGMAVAPQDMGALSGRLLVGNFGDGMINVFQLAVSATQLYDVTFEGVIGESPRRPLVIEGLWGLAFGPGAGGFGAQQLFFTAGPGDEMHGVFGRLDVHQPPNKGCEGTKLHD